MKRVIIQSEDGTQSQLWTSDRVADAMLVLLLACKVPDDRIGRDEAEAGRRYRITASGDGRYCVQSDALGRGQWMTLQIVDTVSEGEARIEEFKTRFIRAREAGQ